MTYQIISENYKFSSKDAAFRINQYKVAISYAVVPCENKETGEVYRDKMYFAEITTIEKLMKIIDGINDFSFTITPGLKEPMSEWDFELIMDDEEEYLYRYPILWIH